VNGNISSRIYTDPQWGGQTGSAGASGAPGTGGEVAATDGGDDTAGVTGGAGRPAGGSGGTGGITDANAGAHGDAATDGVNFIAGVTYFDAVTTAHRVRCVSERAP
jgi:hypothetical protein